jgi:predicted patatin/cPLA2 family phospholipase
MSFQSWRNVVLQGGGIRSFWQGGFLSVVAPQWTQQPNLFCVSASSAIACSFAAGRLLDAVEIFKAATSRNPRNVYPSRIISSKPLFPHAQIYRTALLELFDTEALRTISQGPEVSVLLCRTRTTLSSAGAFGTMVSIELAKQFGARRVCNALIKMSGLRREFIDARSCANGEMLADLILASSCTPPFTPFASFGGSHALDGGVLESVPISSLHADSGSTLVLLTRGQSARSRKIPDATFVAPSAPLVCSPWDYTSPELIASFVELGRRDGLSFLEQRAKHNPQVMPANHQRDDKEAIYK